MMDDICKSPGGKKDISYALETTALQGKNPASTPDAIHLCYIRAIHPNPAYRKQDSDRKKSMGVLHV